MEGMTEGRVKGSTVLDLTPKGFQFVTILECGNFYTL
jgi:hypothetical protein